MSTTSLPKESLTTLPEEGLVKLDNVALLNLWDTTTNSKDRDPLVRALQKKGLFPEVYMKQWDKSVGAYPDYSDPEFLQRLLAKKEFAESFQSTWDPENDPCAADTKFEVTPVQRFAANLMSPRTPYMSALLYHGVGVGKTCSAIQISEAWLEEYPQDQVFIIAPPTIQEGFKTTIFDTASRRLTLGTGIEPNKAFGCTGDTYMELTGTLLERTIDRIDLRVKRAIGRRYRFFGYIQFANYVKSLVSRFAKIEDDEERDLQERQAIRKQFSNKLLIIDEAHNLREVMGESTAKKTEEEENADEPSGKDGADDMKAGKLMTPWLLKVLDYSYGMKLVLMTATPMYNSHLEIVFLLNLLLRNDKKALITQDMVFNKAGDLVEDADKLLGSLASRYVSFMRGENPKSFPLRLKPNLPSANRLTLEEYPIYTMKNREIPQEEKKYVTHLPIVKIPLPVDSENYKASLEFLTNQTNNSNSEKPERGISSQELGLSVQAGNFVPPGTGDYTERIRKGLAGVFEKESKPRIFFKVKAGTDAKWLLKENLIQYSPKFVFLMDKLATCEGVAFVYSRFIESGALPLALALEANGYRCYGRETGFLEGGAQDGLGGQCALCPRRQTNHGEGWAGIESHDFKQAYYGLLTGEKALTPDRNVIIKGEQSVTNRNGTELKIVIGSQIASEGVDLRYVREVHVLDSWYHLNKTEQVIGRAIRFCSHSALEPKKRNTTIYLYAAYYPDMDNETADLYSYRLAFRKARQVGQVSRALKAYAIDCNLNHDAIIIRNQPPVYQTDSQRVGRPKVDFNDVGFTAMCDWIENCDYTCKPRKIEKGDMGTDDSSYSEYAVRWRMAGLKERMRTIFEESVIVELANMEDEFSDVPMIARTDFLTGIIDNKLFQVVHNDVTGYIRFCNNYFVFQPLVYADINIPLAIRMASFPVRKDFFDPEALALLDLSLGTEETPIETSDLGALWTAFEEWTAALSTGKPWIGESKPISDRIVLLARGDRKMNAYYSMILLMMRQFHINVNKGDIDSEAFQRTLLEYVWDNWFSLAEQKQLRIPSMVNEEAYKEGARTVLRFYNPSTDTIQYETDGIRASEAIRKVVQGTEAQDEKEFRSREEGNRFLTGSPYGFLIGKKGLLVFKTNSVPARGVKWDKGKECGNDTKSESKYLQLEMLGDELRKAGRPDLELRAATIRGVLSASQCCIMMELVLRYMDILRLDGKRWFYRPVMARVLGHLGAANEKEELVTGVTKGTATATAAATTTTAAPTATTTAAATAPAKRVIPKGKKPVPVVVTKVDPELDEEGNPVVPVAEARRLTIEEMKRLSKRQLEQLSNDDFPVGIPLSEYRRIYDAAPEETPLSKNIQAIFSSKPPSQTVTVTKEEEERENPMEQLD